MFSGAGSGGAMTKVQPVENEHGTTHGNGKLHVHKSRSVISIPVLERMLRAFESKWGLLTLFVLLLVDVSVVIACGILETQYILSSLNDCKEYVEKCIPRGSRRLSHMADSIVHSVGRGLSGQTTDASCGDIDPDHSFGNHTIHKTEKILAWVSTCILITFFIEQLLLVCAKGKRYFKKTLHLVDMFAISTSLAIELASIHMPLAGLLVLARVWRFGRTGFSTVETTHEVHCLPPVHEFDLRSVCVPKKVANELDEICCEIGEGRCREIAIDQDAHKLKPEEMELVKTLARDKPGLLLATITRVHEQIQKVQEG